MTTQIRPFWFRWLLVVTVVLLLFSASFVLLPDLIYRFFAWMVSPVLNVDAVVTIEAAHYIKLIYGVLGAVMIGWSIALLSILISSFRRGERFGWWSVAASIGIWFIMDTSFSISMGFVPNAIFNLLFLILFSIPLAATYRKFNEEKPITVKHEH